MHIHMYLHIQLYVLSLYYIILYHNIPYIVPYHTQHSASGCPKATRRESICVYVCV